MSHLIAVREEIWRGAGRERYDLGAVLREETTTTPERIVALRVALEMEARRRMAEEETARPDGRAAVEELKAAAPELYAQLAARGLPFSPGDEGEEGEERAVERALEAFRAGTLLFFWNGRQITDMCEELPLRAENEALFLQLVPLRGG